MKLGPNGKPLSPSCLKRKHTYDGAGLCTKCGWKRTGVIGRPARKVAGAEGSARLAATLGVPPPQPSSIFSAAAPAGPAPIVPDAVTPPKPEDKPAALAETAAAAAGDKPAEGKKEPTKAARKLCSRIARKLTRLFDVATDSMIEAFDGKDYTREAGEADEEDLEDFEENLGEVLAEKIPDIEMSPLVATILAGSLIVGDKCLGSKKIPKKPAASITAKEAPDGAPSSRPTDDEDEARSAPAAGSTLSLIPRPA